MTPFVFHSKSDATKIFDSINEFWKLDHVWSKDLNFIEKISSIKIENKFSQISLIGVISKIPPELLALDVIDAPGFDDPSPPPPSNS